MAAEKEGEENMDFSCWGRDERFAGRDGDFVVVVDQCKIGGSMWAKPHVREDRMSGSQRVKRQQGNLEFTANLHSSISLREPPAKFD
jgi:hypothetical protein